MGSYVALSAHNNNHNNILPSAKKNRKAKARTNPSPEGLDFTGIKINPQLSPLSACPNNPSPYADGAGWADRK